MFQNKVVNILLITLIALSLLAIVVVLTYILADGAAKNKPPATEVTFSGAEIQENSLTLEKITTNLADGRMIVLSLSFMMDSAKAKEELQQREIQLKDIIITTLHSQTKTDFETSEGLEAYKLLILQKANEIMSKGTIVDIYIVDKMAQ